jgi:hypothetical protein
MLKKDEIERAHTKIIIFLLVVGTKYEPLMLMSPKILAYAGAWIDVILCQETTISIR